MQTKSEKIKIIVFALFLSLIFLTSVFFTLSLHTSQTLNVKDKLRSEKEVPLKNSDSSRTFEWAWMSGNKTVNIDGIYGTIGVPNSTNCPGSRYDMVSWMDSDGNLWLFGGTDGDFYFNDLWRYNITSNIWTWKSGNKTIDVQGVYGTKGVPNSANYPGCRCDMTSWTDLDGNLWLFGGYGHTELGWGTFNDLWRYNISSNTWTWMSGNKTIDVQGVYGTKGVPSATNYPGSRDGTASWIDFDGNLWLFGGHCYAEPESSYFNDLWRYNISSKMWTWMSGKNNGSLTLGVYGTKGVPNPINHPGSRHIMASWTDLNGYLWLFGGIGLAESGQGFLNDLWRYNLSSNVWTWMSGSKTPNNYGIYGTKGIPNTANCPGSRYDMTSWIDLNGNLWLFGGYGNPESGIYGNLNDLWRYNITTNMWTWISGNKTLCMNGVYGTKRVPSAANYPGSRYGMVSWTDLDGNLWLFGGCGYGELGYSDDLNDLWKFELTLYPIVDDNYEENDVFTSAYNISNNESISLHNIKGLGIQLDEDWYEILAYPIETHLIVDLRFVHAEGNIDLEVYDSSGVSLITGSYSDIDNEYIDYILPSSGTYLLRIFGDNAGNAYDLFWNTSNLNPDYGKFEWTWMSGNKTVNMNGIYGTKGVPNITNYPGSRAGMSSWTDLDGNLWLFGGAGYAESGGYGRLNDLWRYNITSNMWTWMSGNKTVSVNGVYGTKEIPNINNYPGSRSSMTYWTDLNGNLWLFGGSGFAASGSGMLNDLWKYNLTTNMWMWVSGNKTIGVNGVYGTKGIPNVKNFPGSRCEMVSCMDLNGNLWLFGGNGYPELGSNGRLNDLWKYNITTNMWTWMSGNKTVSVNGVYGTRGIFNAANYPGSRRIMTSWTDFNGNLWVFGGDGYPESGSIGYLNDLWRYNTTSNMWTWMSGNKTRNVYGVYGTKGIPNVANCPSSRWLTTSLRDLNGNLWLFGGWGLSDIIECELNDLWRYNITSNMWTWMSGNKTFGVFGVYGTKKVSGAATYPGNRNAMISWMDLNGNLWFFGGMGYAESDIGHLNDLWRFGSPSYLSKDDNYEENDVFASAYNLSNNESIWLHEVKGLGLQMDEDWYEIQANPGEYNLIVDLRFVQAEGNIDLEVYDSSGVSLITESYSDTDNEYIAYILSSSGTYFLRIFGENDSNTYDLHWNTTNLNPSCFVLSTDADPIVYDGSFILSWEKSIDAINYSVYFSYNNITEINSDCMLIASGLEVLYHAINDLLTGDYYYVVLAYNIYGNRTSNCIHIFIGRIPTHFDPTTNAGYPDADGIFYLNWTTALYANNYSIYASNTTITGFDNSLMLIAQGLTNKSYLVNTNRNGYFYYIIIAYNNYGNATSTCIVILVNNPNFVPYVGENNANNDSSNNNNNKNSEKNDSFTLSEGEVAAIVVGSVIVSSAGIATAGTVYYFYGTKRAAKLLQKIGKRKVKNLRKKKSEKIKKKTTNKAEISIKSAKDILTELSNERELLDLFGENQSIETISQILDRTVTVISEDFLNIVDQIGFSDVIKKEFLKEMLSFAPKERALITEDVLKSTVFYPIPPPVKPKKNKKEVIEDVLIYEDYTLELIQEYLEENKQFEANKIVPYLSSRFSKSLIDINENGIKKILKSLVERNILFEGSKMVRNDVLLNSNRKQIYEYIQTNPGVHFNKLIRRLNLSSAVVRWHLNILINFGFVRKELVQNRDTYFDLEVDQEYSELLHIISRKKYLNIIEFLKENDYGISKTKLSKDLGMHINTVSKYLDKLKNLELIKIEKISNQNLYFLNKEFYEKFVNKIVSETD